MSFLNQFKTLLGGGNSTRNASELNALELIDQGNALEDEGCFEQAMQRYEAAIRIAPNLGH